MSYYAEHAQQLKRDLAAALPIEELRKLHDKRPWLHGLIAFANFAALIVAGIAIVHLMAAMSPGPAFVMVTRISVGESRPSTA